MALINKRRGMSFFEIVGCLSAMVGGVVLGSMYLGVDVRSLALSAVRAARGASHSSDAVAAAPQVAAQATEAGATESTATATATKVAASPVAAVEQAETAPAAVTEAPLETTATPAPANPTADPAKPAIATPALEDVIELTDEQQKVLTRAYWAALDEYMKEEVVHRLAGIQDSGNLQLYDYLSCRSEGHGAAAKRIAELSVRGVDVHVTAYAEKANAWHDAGAKLFGRALDLLTDAPSAQLSGPFAQSWQSAATQHRMEEKLLREKHEAVQTYLDHAERSDGAAAEAPAAQPAVTN